ncbi:MAG TPA: efflux RND transporter periplasmic adaptor subunit [Beijerinckiaceae bacterium]|jgi:RND family efflux transporter MFP subunit
MPRNLFALGTGLAVAAHIAGVLPAAAAGPAAKDQAPAAAPFAPTVTTVRADRRELVERLVVSGTVIAREEVMVVAEVDGLRVTEILVDEGDAVKRGQVLARLDRRQLDIQLAQNDASAARVEASIAQARTQIPQAEATLAEARPALERAESLRRSGNVTDASYEQRLSALRGAEARLSAAREGLKFAESEKATIQAQRRDIMLKIERAEIKAPVAGIVSRRNARLGAIAAPGATEPLFRLIQDGALELEAEVLDVRLTRVREGQPASVTAEVGRQVEGRVRLVPAEVDRTTRLGRVRVALPKDDAFRLGAFARAALEVARVNAVSVPASALVFGTGGVTIQVVEGDRVRVRPVKTGISADGTVEIVEGLAGGETVIAKAGAFLRDGDAVKPVAQAAMARGQ